MRKLFVIVLLSILGVYFSSLVSADEEVNNVKEIEYRNYNYIFDYDLYDIRDRIKNFDYVFVATIIKTKETLPYNGRLLDVAFTKYDIKIQYTLKGEISKEKNELIFYGGELNTHFELVENKVSASYPIPINNQTFLFTINKSESDFMSRAKKNSFVVINPVQMTLLEKYDANLSYDEQDESVFDVILDIENKVDEIKVTPQISSCVEFICSDDGSGSGGGGSTPPPNDGSTYDKAIDYNVGANLQLTANGSKKYYKINPTFSGDVRFNVNVLSGNGIPQIDTFYPDEIIDPVTGSLITVYNNNLVYLNSRYINLNKRVDHLYNFTQSNLETYAELKFGGDPIYFSVYSIGEGGGTPQNVEVGITTSISGSSCRVNDSNNNNTSTMQDLLLESYADRYPNVFFDEWIPAYTYSNQNNKIIYRYLDNVEGLLNPTDTHVPYFESAVDKWNALGKVDIINYDTNPVSLVPTMIVINMSDENVDTTPIYVSPSVSRYNSQLNNYYNMPSIRFSYDQLLAEYGTPSIMGGLSVEADNKWTYAFTHELGHALGIADLNVFHNIDGIDYGTRIQESRYNFMTQTVKDYVTELGECDKYVYNYLHD